MASIPFLATYTYDTDGQDQAHALQEIGDYVDVFLSRQPGFVSSRLLASNDGKSIVHQSEWTSEAACLAAGTLARKHPRLPGLRTYKPRWLGYRLARAF